MREGGVDVPNWICSPLRLTPPRSKRYAVCVGRCRSGHAPPGENMLSMNEFSCLSHM